MSDVALERTPSLTDRVVEAVRDGIRERRYAPGEIYSVYRLADELGVSRSPVREALVRLAEAGLVVFSRNRGFEVVLPRARDVAEIFAVRLALEPLAAQRAARTATDTELARLTSLFGAQRAAAGPARRRRTTAHPAGDEAAFWAADRAVHDHIMRVGLGARAADIVDGLRATTSLLGPPTSAPSLRQAKATTARRTLRDIAAEHAPVVSAVTTRDGDSARTAMRRHLEHTGRLLVASVGAWPPGSPAADVLWDDVVGSD